VLWKLSSSEEPGWDSPWGRGRPGWHIECSVMSEAHLGQVFDIHGGGLDLIFPHHENEIAQSRCAHGTKVMANYWMHNGFLQVEGEKMSKSLGNFFTIAEVLADWGGEVARFNMLKTHYRQPIDWTKAALEDSAATLRGWQNDTRDVVATEVDPEMIEALSDDLNAHGAFTRLHQLAKAGEFGKLKASLELLGFSLLPDALRRPGGELVVDEARVNALINARLDARRAKNFAESDRLRDELVGMGIVIMDAKDPVTGELKTTWEVKK